MTDCPTVEDFRLRFPEFNDTIAPDIMIQTYLDDTCNYLNEDKFGDCYLMAVLYHAAHLVTLSIRTTKQAESSADQVAPTPQSGPVSGSSAGGLSINFTGPTPASLTEAWYQLTNYGQHYLQIVNSCVDGTDIAGSAAMPCCGQYRYFV